MAMTEQQTSCDGFAEDLTGMFTGLGGKIILGLAIFTGNFYLVFWSLIGIGVLSFMLLLFTVKRKKKGKRRGR